MNTQYPLSRQQWLKLWYNIFTENDWRTPDDFSIDKSTIHANNRKLLIQNKYNIQYHESEIPHTKYYYGLLSGDSKIINFIILQL